MCGFACRKYTWMAGRHLPLLLSALFLGTWSLTELGVHWVPGSSSLCLSVLELQADIVTPSLFPSSFFLSGCWPVWTQFFFMPVRQILSPLSHLPSLILRSFASVTDADERSISNWTIRNLTSVDIPNALGVDMMLMFPIVKPFRFWTFELSTISWKTKHKRCRYFLCQIFWIKGTNLNVHCKCFRRKSLWSFKYECLSGSSPIGPRKSIIWLFYFNIIFCSSVSWGWGNRCGGQTEDNLQESLLCLSCRSQEMNSGHHTWQHVASHAESSHQPNVNILITIFHKYKKTKIFDSYSQLHNEVYIPPMYRGFTTESWEKKHKTELICNELDFFLAGTGMCPSGKHCSNIVLQKP